MLLHGWRAPVIRTSIFLQRSSLLKNALPLPLQSGHSLLVLPTFGLCKGLVDVTAHDELRPPPEVLLENFFYRGKVVARFVDLIKKCDATENFQEALQGLPVPLDNRLVTEILRGELHCDTALRFFRWLKQCPGFQHNEYTYGIMLNNLGRTGHLQKMQELFDEMKAEGFKVTRVTLTNVISWFYKGKDMASVACHWHKLRRAGIKPSAAIYTAYIDFLLSKNRHGEITHIFEEMLRVDCLPNSRTYSMFIEYLVNAGNPDAGAKIVKLMHCMKVTPSKVAYRILVNGFGRLGKIEQLLDTLSEMREHFYRPTKQLIPAIRALELSGKVEEAREISSEIMSYGNTACVNAISRNGVDIEDEGNDDDDDDGNDGVEADSVRTVWRSAHCSHILFDIGSFVNALYSWNSNVERVLEQENLHWERSLVLGLLRRMKNLDSMWPFFHWLNIKLGFKHDCYGCSFLVRIILKSTLSVDKMDFLIRELFKGVIHDRMGEPAVPLFNLVIRHYVGMGEVDKASEMLKFLKDTGLEPNKFTYKFLIEGFARCCRRREVVLMLKEMEESGFSLESSTSAEVINFLGQIGKIQKAYALFCKIFQSGRKPSCDEYKAIMTIYFMKGENDMALKLYEDMRKYGIKPTQDMYDLVTGILRKAYRFSDMQDLAQERQLYRFFDGRKKVLQENLLEVLFIFTTGLKHKSREFKPGLR